MVSVGFDAGAGGHDAFLVSIGLARNALAAGAIPRWAAAFSWFDVDADGTFVDLFG